MKFEKIIKIFGLNITGSLQAYLPEVTDSKKKGPASAKPFHFIKIIYSITP